MNVHSTLMYLNGKRRKATFGTTWGTTKLNNRTDTTEGKKMVFRSFDEE